jgi:hypothetical protein
MDHIPGAKDIYNCYSNTVKRNNILSIDEYTTICKLMIKLVRYFGYGNCNKLFKMNNIPLSGTGKFKPEYIFAFKLENEKLENVLNLTENSNLDENRNLIAKIIDNTEIEGLDRQNLRIYNIIDMDIVPINVHAMMREVPFANLLNYSYTFDRMIHSVLSPSFSKENYEMIKPNEDVNTVNYLLLKLLTHPYSVLNQYSKPETSLNKPEYSVLFNSLCAGSDGLRLGRPRYLSDQILRKVLLSGYNKFQYDDKKNPFPLVESGPAEISVVSNNNDLELLKKIPYLESYEKSKINNIQHRYIHSFIDNRIISYNRFNTKLVRNLIWLVNLQRIMRVMLITHLDFISTPVISNIQIANPNVTEYEGVEEYDNDDYNGKKYGPFGDYDYE